MQRKNELFVERLPLAADRPIIGYAFALGMSLVALFVRLATQPLLGPAYPYVAFFPAVILTAFLFGAGPGLFVGLLCGYFAWHFFLPPNPAGFGFSSAVALAFYGVVVCIDIWLVHLLQRANRKLAEERGRSAALAENRELLFRELQHRVSNNIQVVAALLALQRRNVTDESAQRALDEASSRLALIGKISRALYEPGQKTVAVRTFIETLSADILDANGRHDINVHLDIDEDVALKPDAAVPVSLIVAEAVSNAIEHGFAGRQGGNIVVKLHQASRGELSLDIIDDGHGLPSNFSADGQDSLGLRIATTLARQLGGSFRLSPADGGGARAVLAFPA